jgi:hypothetical protein
LDCLALVAAFGGGALTRAAIGTPGGLLGELASRVFLIHRDTHIDPPAVAIAAVATLLVSLRVAGGVLPAI